MFKIKNFAELHKFLDNNKYDEANKILIHNREKFYMHPEYLFLMARYLKINKKYYQAIDCLHAALQHNNDLNFLNSKNYEKTTDELVKNIMLLILELSKFIKNQTLIVETEDALKNLDNWKFTQKLDLLMPGVKRNK